jgi:hypothetical protein
VCLKPFQGFMLDSSERKALRASESKRTNIIAVCVGAGSKAAGGGVVDERANTHRAIQQRHAAALHRVADQLPAVNRLLETLHSPQAAHRSGE